MNKKDFLLNIEKYSIRDVELINEIKFESYECPLKHITDINAIIYYKDGSSVSYSLNGIKSLLISKS